MTEQENVRSELLMNRPAEVAKSPLARKGVVQKARLLATQLWTPARLLAMNAGSRKQKTD